MTSNESVSSASPSPYTGCARTRLSVRRVLAEGLLEKKERTLNR